MALARNFTHFSKNEITIFFNTAKKIYANGIIVLKAPAKKPAGRLLVVVSRKVGTAPIRNRIKRQLKAIFHSHNLLSQPFDFAVIVRKEATLWPFSILESTILQALSA